MRSLWNDNDAAGCSGDLAQRTYSSRLLGRNRTLVQHGGGNTSVKIRETNIVSVTEDIIYVKGSGWDLEFMEAEGFSPLRLDHLLRLAQLESLSDPQMVNELVTHVTRASAPTPSVEAILHALLPYRFVDHTHADAIVSITNTADGADRIDEIYGDSVVVIPYVMPGFALARSCAELFPANACPNTIGMVLLNHGIFSFGETARESYERMIHLVDLAERHLARHAATESSERVASPRLPDETAEAARRQVTSYAELRREISTTAGFPVVMGSRNDARIASFISRENLSAISQQGPATPDHVIRTKRLPMITRDVAAYASNYQLYFERNSAAAAAGSAPSAPPMLSLDPAPRVILDPELGMCTVGRSATDAAIVADLYSHTIDIIEGAERLGGYKTLPERDIFDVEYWDLEQAKLRKGGKPPMFAGEVALVTGAASGIGKACVESLLARGAAVVGVDMNPDITVAYDRPDFLGIAADVTSPHAITDALRATARCFGGLDMLILNAGIFPVSSAIAELTAELWRRVMDVNLDANYALLRECYPLLRLAPNGGRVVVIGSKNVPAPGPGLAAYSASKAALTQIARVAALEWGRDNIRINTLHPNAVFDTALWTDEVIEARAADYGVGVDDYRKRNVLGVEVTSRDVAELAAEMCGPLFAKTTGAQVPVDGGNERVI